MSHRIATRLCAFGLPLLMALLPFEPPAPALKFLGLRFTALETLAAVLMTAMLWASHDRILPLLHRPPLPLVFLGGYAAAHLLSAAVAPSHRLLAGIFSLRMVACAVFALLVVLVPSHAARRGLLAAAAGSCLVAALCVLEGSGVRSLDPFLDLFRRTPFLTGASRRASGGTENPNFAAAFIMYGFVPILALASEVGRPLRVVAPLVTLLSAGLFFTYSRGGLAATGVSVLTLAAALGWRDARRASAPAVAFAALAVAAVVLAVRADLGRAEAARLLLGARYEPTEASLRLRPGETRPAPIRVTNAGHETWKPAGAFQVRVRWYDISRGEILGAGGAAIARAVAPGESVELELRLQAPEKEGPYLLVWDLSDPEIGLFSWVGVAPAQVPVSVSLDGRASPPMGFRLPHSTWGRGRLELWRLALAMWRERPLTGVGPDNFRWLHGDYGGWIKPDVQTRAHSLYLEVAATTGSLGLLALLGTLLSTAMAALRHLKATEASSPQALLGAVALGLTAAIAAHGTVEYVLGSTGHYLLLGFVVGIASSPGPREGRGGTGGGSVGP